MLVASNSSDIDINMLAAMVVWEDICRLVDLSEQLLLIACNDFFIHLTQP